MLIYTIPKAVICSHLCNNNNKSFQGVLWFLTDRSRFKATLYSVPRIPLVLSTATEQLPSKPAAVTITNSNAAINTVIIITYRVIQIVIYCTFNVPHD